MVITYYGKLIRKMANRHNHISVSLLLLVAQAIRNTVNIFFANNLPLTEIFQNTFLFELPSTGLLVVCCRALVGEEEGANFQLAEGEPSDFPQ